MGVLAPAAPTSVGRRGVIPRTVPLGRALPTGAPNAMLVEHEPVTATIHRLRVRPDRSVPTFEAGQYFAIGLELEGGFIQRPYSTASPPGTTDELEFLVRLVPGGQLTPLLWRLRRGDRVRLGPPRGLFRLDPDTRRRQLFIATGTGIAPLLAMLLDHLRRTGREEPDRVDRPDGGAAPPILLHGVASAPELAYRRVLERLSSAGDILYVPAVSRPADPANAGWRGVAGRLDAVLPEIAASTGLDPLASVAYVCGNPGMIGAVERVLVSLGFPSSAVRTEHYWTPAA
ncbi:MAG TPA: FAD-binding oxidoreductase [Candidatus Limnocylindrales bacterium]